MDRFDELCRDAMAVREEVDLWERVRPRDRQQPFSLDLFVCSLAGAAALLALWWFAPVGSPNSPEPVIASKGVDGSGDRALIAWIAYGR